MTIQEIKGESSIQLSVEGQVDTITAPELQQSIESFREKYGADITVMDMLPVDASSTNIRNLIKEGKPITGLVPPGVEEYIIEHKLYK